jgi:F0F1-type ATP synthase alpha subunit
LLILLTWLTLPAIFCCYHDLYHLPPWINFIDQVFFIPNKIAQLYGVNKVWLEEMAEFNDGVKGMALNLESDNVGVVLFESDTAVNS